ncbi:hypothetical protein BLOT_008385, partial [Blomia tropicalis]
SFGISAACDLAQYTTFGPYAAKIGKSRQSLGNDQTALKKKNYYWDASQMQTSSSFICVRLCPCQVNQVILPYLPSLTTHLSNWLLSSASLFLFGSSLRRLPFFFDCGIILVKTANTYNGGIPYIHT